MGHCADGGSAPRQYRGHIVREGSMLLQATPCPRCGRRNDVLRWLNPHFVCGACLAQSAPAEDFRAAPAGVDTMKAVRALPCGFTVAEWARLCAYRAAIRAGFFNDAA